MKEGKMKGRDTRRREEREGRAETYFQSLSPDPGMSCLTRPVIPCDVCAALPAMPLRCSACHTAFYCSRACQKKDFKQHKAACNQFVTSLAAKRPENNRPVIPDSLRYGSEDEARECLICFETFPKSEQQRFGDCGHTFCVTCSWKHHQTVMSAESSVADIVDPARPSPVTCPFCRAPHQLNTKTKTTLPIDPARVYAEKLKEKSLFFPVCNAEYEDLATVVYRANGVLDDARLRDSNVEFLEGMRFAAEGLDKMLARDPGSETLLNVAMTRVEVHTYLGEWEECLSLCKRYVEDGGVLALPNVPSVRRADGTIVSEESKDNYRLQMFLMMTEALLELKRFDEALGGVIQNVGNYLHFKNWDSRSNSVCDHEWLASVATETRQFYHLHARLLCETEKFEECLSFSKAVVEMNRLSKGIYIPVARSQRGMGDLDGAIETMREAVKRAEPWDKANLAKNEAYLEELVKAYNEELMAEMDVAEWHEAYKSAVEKCAREGTREEDSKMWELIKAYRAKFSK
jgi:hypothetical protein